MVLLSDSSEEESSSSPSPSDELSELPESENEFDETGIAEEPALPPSKRQKLGAGGSRASSAQHIEPEPDSEHDLEGDISSDTSGDVPNSPINAKLDEEEFQEQVTVCAWDRCDAGDLGNMDKLVEHIHNDHIESRQKKYTCEWVGCTRKSMPHASGYALKAHMRSHTREKPFYCYLPECDRAFTRSDALAKHMRTVHETEALRPSDPVPKSMQSSSGAKGKPLKIILKTPQSHSTQEDSVDDGDGSDEISAEFLTPLTQKHGFTPAELEMDIKSLFRHLALTIKAHTAEIEKLKPECQALEEKYHQEWLEKEVLLDQMAQVEEDWWQRRKAVLAAEAKKQAELDELARQEEAEEEAAAAAAEAEAEAAAEAEEEAEARSESPSADKAKREGGADDMEVESSSKKADSDNPKVDLKDEDGDEAMSQAE